MSGVLAVLDAEIASLPTMATMASHGGTECDPAEAIERLTEARATVEAMERQCSHLTAMVRGRFYAMPGPTVDALRRECDAMDDALARFHGGAK